MVNFGGNYLATSHRDESQRGRKRCILGVLTTIGAIEVALGANTISADSQEKSGPGFTLGLAGARALSRARAPIGRGLV